MICIWGKLELSKTLKYSKYLNHKLEKLSPNSSRNSKNGYNLNSICVRTQSSEARWNSNLTKCGLVQALQLSLGQCKDFLSNFKYEVSKIWAFMSNTILVAKCSIAQTMLELMLKLQKHSNLHPFTPTVFGVFLNLFSQVVICCYCWHSKLVLPCW